MSEPTPLSNELERLAAVARYAVMDTEPEPTYEDIVRLAAHLCAAPIASISLVDERREWFKARVGFELGEIPRERSLCEPLIASGLPLEIEDTHADPSFAASPQVVGPPCARYYAGAPLVTKEGLVLGVLSVIDQVPRKLRATQLDMLAGLARIVVRELDHRMKDQARAEAEAALEAARAQAASAERLRQRFFEVSLDMLCIASFEGYFQELNPAWSKTLGWTKEELCAKPFVEFVHPEDREATISEAAALGEGDHVTIHFTNRYATKDGGYRWLEWSSAPDSANQVLLAVARDISEQKAHENELIAARELAELANTAKSDFLAKMSHELRTPLNSVIGFTNLLHKNRRGNLEPKDLLYLEKIGSNGMHLLSLINDLLDLSKIEAGRTELEVGPVALDALGAELLRELEGVIRAAGNRFLITIPAGLEPLEADYRRLKQILINLIGNANKFTDLGVVELRVWASSDAPARPRRIDVIDSGIGIAPAQVELVFEAFRQASEGGARTHGGTGLGLAISRSLAELHGFELGVVSVEGQGSTFYLKLDADTPSPQHRSPSTVESSPRASALAPSPAPPARVVDEPERTVLLIEDDSDARQLMAKAVERIGARVVTADSGLAGLAIAHALRPALILLDLSLPDLDGREVVRRLSAEPTLAHIPVVVFSGEGDNDSEGRPSSVLDKPTELDAMVEAISAQLGARRRVLIVDDDSDTRAMLRSMLSNLGVVSEEAGDGLEAFARLRAQEFDLVLLDICMPKMTGFEFLAQLRADPQLRETQVVICTALDLEPSEAREVEGEAQALIRKGINLEGRLEQVVHKLIWEREP